MKQIIFFIALISVLCFLPQRVQAIEDPLKAPNNKVGIHILFPSELSEAAKLVNSNGGDWGYVIIPIQSGDKDREKWQNFMNEAGKLHVIPILRLATQGDYFNTAVWSKPKYIDVIDFANFLNSLHWPTKNRYVVIYNETNRADEWGGNVNPTEYAQVLSYAVTIFKTKSEDFFIIGGGFDNAAPEQGTTFNNQYLYMRRMNEAVPGIFNQIDGYASHSYPNPGFSQPPSVNTPQSIASFTYERDLLKKLSNKSLPIFITETGWSADSVSDTLRANYYHQAFSTVWNDPDVIAITPFLLRAHGGPFTKFSFLNEDGNKTEQYQAIESLPKISGEPLLSTKVLGITNDSPINPPKKKFTRAKRTSEIAPLSQVFQSVFAWMMKL